MFVFVHKSLFRCARPWGSPRDQRGELNEGLGFLCRKLKINRYDTNTQTNTELPGSHLPFASCSGPHAGLWAETGFLKTASQASQAPPGVGDATGRRLGARDQRFWSQRCTNMCHGDAQLPSGCHSLTALYFHTKNSVRK